MENNEKTQGHLERASEELRQYFENEKPGTTRFMALCDIIDNNNAYETAREWEASFDRNGHASAKRVADYILAKTRCEIVASRISGRTAEIPGYYREYAECRARYNDYKKLLASQGQIGGEPINLLDSIKGDILSRVLSTQS